MFIFSMNIFKRLIQSVGVLSSNCVMIVDNIFVKKIADLKMRMLKRLLTNSGCCKNVSANKV